MICTVCRAEVPDTFEFCDQCGSRLPAAMQSPPPHQVGSPAQAALVTVAGRRFLLTKPDMLIGRFDPSSPQPPDIDLSVDDTNRTVSRRHARILHREGRYLLQVEPTARNPGEKDGVRLQQGVIVPLMNGDRFVLGKVELTFQG